MPKSCLIVRSIVAAILSFLPISVSARPVQIWSIQELTEKADLVIVGTVSSTSDAKNHVYPNARKDTWVAVDTTFDVGTVLKGNLKSKTLTVRHERYYMPNAEIEVIDGPSFVEFSSILKNRYLIFLKRTENGLLEPLTGQYDPGNSFYMLDEYHISKERGTSEASKGLSKGIKK